MAPENPTVGGRWLPATKNHDNMPGKAMASKFFVMSPYPCESTGTEKD